MSLLETEQIITKLMKSIGVWADQHSLKIDQHVIYDGKEINIKLTLMAEPTEAAPQTTVMEKDI